MTQVIHQSHQKIPQTEYWDSGNPNQKMHMFNGKMNQRGFQATEEIRTYATLDEEKP